MQLVREGTDSGEAVVIEAPDGSRDSLYLAQDPVTGTRWRGTLAAYFGLARCDRGFGGARFLRHERLDSA